MGYKGSDNIKKKLTESLNPKLLVDLVADLLFAKGFSRIHKTDGPGDGGRDLYAESGNGDKILVQCKYHKDSEKACGTRELSELPMALIKFNYTHGIFITNARISPQAKREYLDNYPNLKLIFTDGDELSLSILESPLLRSIWFDGDSIYKREPSIRLPILIREHLGDLPFIIQEHASKKNLKKLDKYLKEKFPDLKVSIKSKRIDTDRFEPYKAPLPLTTEEGGSSLFSFSELIVEGVDSLAFVEPLIEKISYVLLKWLKEQLDGVTLRFGKLYISARKDDGERTEIDLDTNPQSYVATKDFIGKELEFVHIGESTDWTGVTDARVTEASYIRLYNQELNLCVDYRIQSRIGWKEQLQKLALRENRKIGWNKSVFCLVESFDTWPFNEIPEPDESVIWIDEKYTLCGWLHFSLLGLPSSTRSRDNNGIDSFLKLPDETEFQKRQQNIKVALSETSSVQILTPKKARHMIAVTGNDLFDIPEEFIYICGEIIEYPERVPSPILPSSRQFYIEVVLVNKEADILIYPTFLKHLEDLKFVDDIESDIGTNHCHLRITLSITGINSEKTSSLLQKVYLMSKSVVEVINRESPSGTHIATKEYWKVNYKVSLGVNWNESEKTYGFATNNKEPMEYQDVMRILTS